MIIITGGAGFIGSNLVHGLNSRGINEILVVDDLTDRKKCINLSDANIYDYIDKDDFLLHIRSGHDFGPVQAIYHQGACSATTEWDGRLVMKVNYEYTKELFNWSISHKLPFYYASSASVYGNGRDFKEYRKNERSLNAFAYSKFLFDAYVRNLINEIKSLVVGLRYFNVYGTREHHKGTMASVALHFYQ